MGQVQRRVAQLDVRRNCSSVFAGEDCLKNLEIVDIFFVLFTSLEHVLARKSTRKFVNGICSFCIISRTMSSVSTKLLVSNPTTGLALCRLLGFESTWGIDYWYGYSL